MKVLVACEFSGLVRDAFLEKGHEAMSCDLLDTEREGPHYKGDVRDIIKDGWDMMIAHPPCTHLAVSGARWFNGKEKKQEEALEFFKLLLNAPIEKVCVENPVSVISTKIRRPNQVVHPWMFGHSESKSTCLWLRNLPMLDSTKLVTGREPKVHYVGQTGTRWKVRSRTYSGLAKAFAEQWG